MAVIHRTECIRFGNTMQGIVWVLAVVAAASADCQQAEKEVLGAGFAASAVLKRPATGEICGDNSCCTNATEQEMLAENMRRIEIFLNNSISKLSSLIDTRAKKFDGLFRELMNKSRRDFHEMFQKTYGKIYLQNSDVFSDFFKELETYYSKGSLRLTDTLEAFFGILYQKMFSVINSQYTFDDKYLDCVSEHMMEVKPFGDVPHKFTLQLRRSFVATRTYYRALMTAAEAARRIRDVKIQKECGAAMVQMRYCGICKGLRGTGTCSSYCTNVLEVCLRKYTEFGQAWDDFIEALDKVADRLVGPYNIEMVVEPLNIKISEAIMNFQESGTDVSRKIYTMCGKPTLSRRKRKVDFPQGVEDDPSYEIKYAPVKMHGRKKKKSKKKYQEEDSGPTLEKLIKEIKSKIRETRQFWAHLPYQYCNDITSSLSSTSCWNGTSVGEYARPVATPAGPKSPLVQEQVFNLQIFTDRLRKAYNGDEVEIVDDSDDAEGSGSGSGDFEIDETEEEAKSVDADVRETPPPPPPSTPRPEAPPTYSAGASISLSRALLQYLLPIVLVWFGGAITDLL